MTEVELKDKETDMVEVRTVLVPPKLTEFTEKAWKSFSVEYDHYRDKGGRVEPSHLVSMEVWEVMTILIPEINGKISEIDLFTAIESFFAPDSKIEAVSRLKEVQMVQRLELEAFTKYTLAFQSKMKHALSLGVSESLCIRTFVEGLFPRRLRERVTLDDPRTMVETIRIALMHLRTMQAAQAEVQAMSKNSGKDNAKTFHKNGEMVIKKDQALVPGSSETKCYYCNKPGHMKRNCQKRLNDQSNGQPRPSWSRSESGRLEKVDGSAKKAEEESAARPMVQLIIQTDEVEVPVLALLDTGSTQSFISSDKAKQLVEKGACVRKIKPKQYSTAGNSILRSSEELVVRATIEDSRLLKRLTFAITLLVIEDSDEMIIGYKDICNFGLTPLFDNEMSSNGTSMPSEDNEAGVKTDQGVWITRGPAYEKLADLVEKHNVLFKSQVNEPAKVEPMTIELKEGQFPKPVPPRRLAPRLKTFVQEEVSNLLEEGVISPSRSPYASPIVVVKKGENAYRMCVDYRMVNDCTVDLKYPLQQVSDVVERLRGAKHFATLDLKSGFHQVPLVPEAKKLTAFATPDGLFEFNRIPFGLKNAPSFFQLIMTKALQGLQGVEVFIDDICVHGEQVEIFLERLEEVFRRLEELGFHLKGSKCNLGVQEVKFLGHIVDGRGVRPCPDRIKALEEIPSPRNLTQLRSFVGMANFLRQFVPNFASMIKPLTGKCSASVKFDWNEECQKAFKLIKQEIGKATLLYHVDYELPLWLRTDASLLGLGGYLYQRVNGVHRPVYFVSKAFSLAESKWSTIEQEAYGIYHCITTLSPYLLGQNFICETDHRNLVYMQKSATPKVIRWRLRLMEFDFSIVHVSGEENVVADALSRCLAIRTLEHESDIAQVHNDACGHLGIFTTCASLKQEGKQWKNMAADVAAFINACPVCQKNRYEYQSLHSVPRTTETYEPFECVAIDTMGPLTTDQQGMKYIIVMIDTFTRFVELKATRTATALDAAAALVELCGRYGPPAYLRSDQGPQYVAAVISELLLLLGVKRQLTLAYKPSANGIVERANAEIGKHLRALVMTRKIQEHWSECLPLIQRIINATPHSATGVAPIRLVFGDMVSPNREVLNIEKRKPTGEYSTYVMKLQEQQLLLLQTSIKHQDEVMQKRIDKVREQPTVLQEGEYVLSKWPNNRPPGKLSPRWKGPYIVIRKHGNRTNQYDCKNLRTLEVETLHLENMRRFAVGSGVDPVQISAFDTAEYIVEKILAHRRVRGGIRNKKAGFEFLVAWYGFGEEDNSWEGYNGLKHTEALQSYLAGHPEIQ